LANTYGLGTTVSIHAVIQKRADGEKVHLWTRNPASAVGGKNELRDLPVLSQIEIEMNMGMAISINLTLDMTYEQGMVSSKTRCVTPATTLRSGLHTRNWDCLPREHSGSSQSRILVLAQTASR